MVKIRNYGEPVVLKVPRVREDGMPWIEEVPIQPNQLLKTDDPSVVREAKKISRLHISGQTSVGGEDQVESSEEFDLDPQTPPTDPSGEGDGKGDADQDEGTRYTKSDLQELKVEQVRDIATLLGINGAAAETKKNLIQMILEVQNNET